MVRELKRGQIRKIIEEAMRLSATITLRETISLDDIYKIAEALKGEPLTRREKLIISGIVSYDYPRANKSRGGGQKSRLQILIVF
ncbi:hypothetical protein AciM339_0231 [Aciduliprofundum sp. MAR08-339]|uniref:hypothetical protein n=1 Tax=Aciduliprofundum sp. (strain MAR08-339) TaxID=673860 RepID=UPI0002A4C314|nr:hypothetical protein AciM339_0199 [Aciduliprofundum sp. MAR08-339]AGB04128.1 hypothetical protein AciM339_0231 [Aciduliprofundum sp. MAR08-339]